MGKKLVVKVNGNSYEVELGNLTCSPATVFVNGKPYEVEIDEAGVPAVELAAPTAVSTPVPQAAVAAPIANANELTAPMPGKILDIAVKPGDKVAVGQPICALEAMKMKNIIRSPRVGVVASVEVVDGQKVPYGAIIIRYA
jgi:Acetyl/propionyl-CoA carboxylase, alpha subunit